MKENQTTIIEERREAQVTPLWGQMEAARYLRISLVTLARMYKAGKIPVHRLGKACYFAKSEIDRALGLPTEEADDA